MVSSNGFSATQVNSINGDRVHSVQIVDKTGRVHAVKYIKSNIDEDTVELIAESVFNGKLIESWKKSSAETFKKP